MYPIKQTKKYNTASIFADMILSYRFSVVNTLVKEAKFRFMNATWKYRMRKFQKMNLTTLLATILIFSDKLNFLTMRKTTASTIIIRMTSDTPLSFRIRLFSGIVGSFI